MRVQLAVAAFVTCLLSGSGQSAAYTVGENVGDGYLFLHDDPVEGVYSNSWTGKRLRGDGSDQTEVDIVGEGKTANFRGIISLNCTSASGYYWEANEAKAAEQVPIMAVANAFRFFCNR